MSRYVFSGIIERVEDSFDDYNYVPFHCFLPILTIPALVAWLYLILEMLENHFFIPVLGWFIKPGIIVLCAVVVYIVVFIFVEHKVLSLILPVLFLLILLLVCSYSGLDIIASRAAYSYDFKSISVYTNTEAFSLEDGTTISEGTQFLCTFIKSNKYTKTFNGTAVMKQTDGSSLYIPVNVKFSLNSFPFEKITDNQTSYALVSFKNEIYRIYTKHSEAFKEELLSTGLCPEFHIADDGLFAEIVKENGGVILSRSWFGLFKRGQYFYYFESKSDYSKFKKIYRNNLYNYNLDCYTMTSSIGKRFSAYGI